MGESRVAVRVPIRNEAAEVARPLRSGRHFELQRRHQPALLATPFFIPEKEGPVLLHWPAEVESVVVVLQYRFWLPRPIIEEVSRVKTIAPFELKSGAVKLIAAAFGNQIDDGALRLAVLCAEAITLYAELLNGVDGGEDEQGRI